MSIDVGHSTMTSKGFIKKPKPFANSTRNRVKLVEEPDINVPQCYINNLGNPTPKMLL